ncbi:MAG: hypothetical protein LBT26_03535 [Clostridiales Family XIII bacterium]|jgi:hypothetical protein|nr:hypothetical protein [Clostridiales Family XIII bacterium]
MPDAIIRHTLDLVIRLIDSASGQTAHGVTRLSKDGMPLDVRANSDGQLLLSNFPRDDFDLGIQVRGYEPETKRIAFGELDENPPYAEIHLTPGAFYGGGACRDIEGKCPGVKSVDAARAGGTICFAQEYDEKKLQLTLYNPYKQQIDLRYYALLAPDAESFEPIDVKKQISDTVCRLEKPLGAPFVQSPLARRVCGMAGGGAYRLRVRDDSTDARWIVRVTQEEGCRFQVVDFSDPKAGASAGSFHPRGDP